MLSGYRIMWVMVLFDLPVVSKKERKAATGFRNFLLDQGFEMAQYSVYVRFTAGKEQAEVFTRRIEQNLPKAGKVHILYFTDKQYENVRTFHGRSETDSGKTPDQFQLF